MEEIEWRGGTPMEGETGETRFGISFFLEAADVFGGSGGKGFCHHTFPTMT